VFDIDRGATAPHKRKTSRDVWSRAVGRDLDGLTGILRSAAHQVVKSPRERNLSNGGSESQALLVVRAEARSPPCDAERPQAPVSSKRWLASRDTGATDPHCRQSQAISEGQDGMWGKRVGSRVTYACPAEIANPVQVTEGELAEW